MSEDSGFKSLFAFITGVAVGTVVGILIAPESGKNTRKKIKKLAEDVGEQATDSFETLKDKVEEIKDKVMHVSQKSVKGRR